MGNEKMVRSLLNSGYDANSQGTLGCPPLLCADFAKPGIVKLLLDAGAEFDSTVDFWNADHVRPLHMAIVARSLESIKLLLDAGDRISCDIEDIEMLSDLPTSFLDDAVTDMVKMAVQQRGVTSNNSEYEEM